MLEWWLNAVFASEYFENVYVNVHHLSKSVIKFVKDYVKKTGFDIIINDESERLLGTAGTLYWHGASGPDIMVAYVDTFSSTMFNSLPRIAELWIKAKSFCAAGILVFRSPKDGSGGSVFYDKLNGNVTGFCEKSTLNTDVEHYWAGILFADPELLYKYLTQDDFDLAKDVFPKIVKDGQLKVLSEVDAYDIGRGPQEYESFKHSFQSSANHSA